MAAAQEGHLKIVEMLIASKANVNHQNNVSCLWSVYVHVSYELTSSMHAAPVYCHVDVVRSLAQTGISLTLK